MGNTLERLAPSYVGTVHPHACGEHSDATYRRYLENGSSPRMWGTLPLVHRAPGGRRFIPTHVGNTGSISSADTRVTVHPHACGEHSWDDCIGASLAGSSPRMWGTLRPVHVSRLALRFIPTHVGNTGDGGRGDQSSPVHPHACGEHDEILASVMIASGSSPRMWGTLYDCRITGPIRRFIPTHVGNTLAPSRRLRAWPVHPHACGEHNRYRVAY